MTTLLTYNLAVQAFDERDYRTAVERFSELLEAEPGTTTCASTWRGPTTTVRR